jgi:hypothetical protein
VLQPACAERIDDFDAFALEATPDEPWRSEKDDVDREE